MVNFEVIDTGVPKAGPYNLGVKTGNLIFISGQFTAPEARDIRSQTLAVFEKIKKKIRICWSKSL
jgi:enamine deaminase RidA (YjgF/YER057c/UK114 family)